MQNIKNVLKQKMMFFKKSQLSEIQTIIIAIIVLLVVLAIIMMANPKFAEALGITKIVLLRGGG